MDRRNDSSPPSREHTLRVIRDFGMSLLQQDSLEATVWEIAKGAIARLDFEDCVVYLLDRDREVLTQVAAHGPKNPKSWDILNPIEIPVGRGVVGRAAAESQTQLIEDTRLAEEYIVDDEARLSELAVPMVHGDEVIGVVDSEHHEVGYYTPHRVEVLQAIASMAASRIVALQTIDRLRESERHLREQQQELQRAREEAESAAEVKSMFLANMSHEIRTPLAAILGFTNKLRSTKLSNEQRFDLETIARNGQHLKSIVDDILDLTKLEAGQLRIEDRCFEPRRMVLDVCRVLESKGQERGLTLSVAVDPSVPVACFSDPLRVRQILINLVGNAVRHVPAGSPPIEIQVSVIDLARPARDRALCFAVRDRGPGIEPELLSKVFEDFTRRTSVGSGVGLGLSISRRLARLLGGEITADSTVGVGSTFRLLLPLQDADSAIGTREIPNTGDRPGQTKPTRVLVADDCVDMRQLVSFYLDRDEFETTLVQNGKEALEAWEQHGPFDAVLMDMQMPVMDGYTAVRHLRLLGCTRPILAFTAHAMSGDEARCMEAGCTGYITKPFSEARLLEEIQQCVRAGEA